MTKQEHIKRHKELHHALDELVADFLDHNKDTRLGGTNLMAFMQWSHKQTIDPDKDEHSQGVEIWQH